MANGTTINAELFEALRDIGIEEKGAARVARAVPPPDTIATKVEVADVRAAIPDAADRVTTDTAIEEIRADIKVIKEELKSIHVRNERTDARADADRRVSYFMFGITSTMLIALLGITLTSLLSS